MSNYTITTIIIAAVFVIVGLTITPYALIGLIVAWAYYEYKVRHQ